MSGATSRCDSPGTHAKDAGTAYEMLSTRTVPVSGALVIIYVTSGGHIVEKDQGFGTGPGASEFPSRSSPATVTVAMSIGSLNVRTIDASSGTKASPFTGRVDTTYGGVQIVRNDHGFGAGPGTSRSPSRSAPPALSPAYCRHSAMAA